MFLEAPYANEAYYLDDYHGAHAATEGLATALGAASVDIDELTYRRAATRDLTDFQAGCVKKACCIIADFRLENDDLINAVVSGYSINGVSVQYSADAPGVTIVGDVITSRQAYALLKSAGLTCRSVRA